MITLTPLHLLIIALLMLCTYLLARINDRDRIAPKKKAKKQYARAGRDIGTQAGRDIHYHPPVPDVKREHDVITHQMFQYMINKDRELARAKEELYKAKLQQVYRFPVLPFKVGSEKAKRA